MALGVVGTPPNAFLTGEDTFSATGATLILFSSLPMDGSSSISHRNDSKSERLIVFLREECFIMDYFNREMSVITSSEV